MKAMQTRVYTNVILTVIAMLLAVLALQPVLQFSSNAYAQRERSYDRNVDLGSEYVSGLDPTREGDYASSSEMIADAQRQIAGAIQEMADAIKESGSATSSSMDDSAQAQRDIADAIRSLGNL